jgi:hypothetical protein
MAATAGTTRPPGSCTDAFWLAHSEGFRVETPAGRLGYVEEVLSERGSGEVLALRVRTRGGVQYVVAADVVELRPERELILARAPEA